MYNAALSSDIFNDLMNGKMINKTTFNNAGQFVDNELFIEIITNLKDYRTQYEMNGFEFVETNNYFFIRDRVNNKDDLKTDISMRACLMLLLLGKYCSGLIIPDTILGGTVATMT
ncbi:condensin complex protein MksE [Aeromonas hydrophila]|uniref:condensin complex protein MksE n=1 Tax=Aeromonas hydrophila TaxID=644 RepID=UPI003F7A5928